jgi:hypothetical protein
MFCIISDGGMPSVVLSLPLAPAESDPTHGFFIETDLVTQGAQQNGQVSLGYYAARTPVCDGCP